MTSISCQICSTNNIIKLQLFVALKHGFNVNNHDMIFHSRILGIEEVERKI
jgi:hypothetical protein